jgi:hypothetical protein
MCSCLMIEIGYGFFLSSGVGMSGVCVHSRILFYCTQSLIQTRKAIRKLCFFILEELFCLWLNDEDKETRGGTRL